MFLLSWILCNPVSLITKENLVKWVYRLFVSLLFPSNKILWMILIGHYTVVIDILCISHGLTDVNDPRIRVLLLIIV